MPKIIVHIEQKVDSPEEFIIYYKNMTKALITQGRHLQIPNAVLGNLTIIATLAFLKAFLKDPSKKNILRKIGDLYELAERMDNDV